VAFHVLPLERRTLHGHLSPALPPVLTIASGDTVRFSTLDGDWGLEPNPDGGAPRTPFVTRDPELDRGHALCGPVAIEGARPGMTIEVQVGHVRTGTWGWTEAGGWPHEINRRLGLVDDHHAIHWNLDPDRGVATSHTGRSVAIRPFMGVMGLAPAEPGIHATSPPRATGGNLDCRELTAGASLYLPVAVDGGLFSTGDGHAQGDGEVGETAIECPIERCDLTFVLHPDLTIAAPRARTADGWLTFGLHEDLDEAMALALDGMLVLLGELHGMGRAEALAMASVVVDLRVTQVVNGTKGVHAFLPAGAIR
jgi:acetamidase/formamidase